MKRIITFWLMMAVSMSSNLIAQQKITLEKPLSSKQESIVTISASTAKGDLLQLQKALNEGLNSGLTINEIKEVIVHLYAYAGFPRSIRGLRTFMTVLDERKAKGIEDVMGAEASPINDELSKYERGKAILDTLLGAPPEWPQNRLFGLCPGNRSLPQRASFR